MIRDALQKPSPSECEDHKRQLKSLIDAIEAALRARLAVDIAKGKGAAEAVHIVVNAIPSDAKNRPLARQELIDLGEAVGLAAVLEAMNWGDYEILLNMFHDVIEWNGPTTPKLLSRDPDAALDAIQRLLAHCFGDEDVSRRTALLKDINCLEEGAGPDSAIHRRIGRPYSNVGQVPAVARRDPFEVDPDEVDRGNQAHAVTQDALADFLRGKNIQPLRPEPDEPMFDLAWEHNGFVFVAEVKSITAKNEEQQLRLGLGQVLRYRQALEARGMKVVPVLVPERRPAELGWADLCKALGLKLVWPGAFESL